MSHIQECLTSGVPGSVGPVLSTADGGIVGGIVCRIARILPRENDIHIERERIIPHLDFGVCQYLHGSHDSCLHLDCPCRNTAPTFACFCFINQMVSQCVIWFIWVLSHLSILVVSHIPWRVARLSNIQKISEWPSHLPFLRKEPAGPSLFAQLHPNTLWNRHVTCTFPWGI